MKKILQNPAATLRKIAKEIKGKEFKTQELFSLLSEMEKILGSEKDGVGLAAPQIGISKRIFIVSPKIFKKPERHLIYINPKITKHSKKLVTQEEGCLSVRGMYGKIKRAEKVNLEAYDENGQKFSRGASGLLAEIFQHEIDHLDGKLFIDKAWDIKKIKDNKQ